MAAQDLAYQVRGITTTTSDDHHHHSSGGGGGDEGAEEDLPGVEEGVEPDPSTLLASLTPVNAAKHGLSSLPHNHNGQDLNQEEGEDGSGQGQESILIAAAENKRSLAAQRARQEAADAVLLCLSQSFLPALQVLPSHQNKNRTHP